MNRTNRILFPLACFSVFVVSLIVRCINIDARSIWFDEASSWLTAKMPIAELINSLTQSTHVPLYFPILNLWMTAFGESPTSIRSLSVCLGMCTVIGTGYLGCMTLNCKVPKTRPADIFNSDLRSDADSQKRALKHLANCHWFGLFCAAICGVNAFQVHASVEARMYSMGTFFTVLSTALTLQVRIHPNRPACWISLAAVTVASLYTHHLLALTAMVQALWLGWHFVWPRVASSTTLPSAAVRRYWCVAVGSVLVGWLPGLILWWKQFHRIRQGFWIPQMNEWTVPRTCVEFFASPPPGRWWEHRDFGIPLLILSTFVFAFCWRKGGATVRLLVLQAIVPMAVIGLVSLKTPLWEARYFRFAHVSLLLCVAFAVWQVSFRFAIRRSLTGMTFLFMLSGTFLFWQWRDVSNRQAVRGAANLIHSDTESANNPVIVTSPMDFIVMKFYSSYLGWSDDRVKLWTGSNQSPGPVIHLVSPSDWWNRTTSGMTARQEFWLVERAQAKSLLPNFRHSTTQPNFASDLWLGEWTVRVSKGSEAE